MTTFPNFLNRVSGFSEQIMLGRRLLPVGGLKNLPSADHPPIGGDASSGAFL